MTCKETNDNRTNNYNIKIQTVLFIFAAADYINVDDTAVDLQ